MNKPASLDTHALLRWLLNDVPGQANAVDKLLQTHHSIHLADLAIAEVALILETIYHLPRPLIADHLELIMAQGQINCNRHLISQVIPAYIQQPQLSFIDCCLAVYAELNQALPLLTFNPSLASSLPQTTLIG